MSKGWGQTKPGTTEYSLNYLESILVPNAQCEKEINNKIDELKSLEDSGGIAKSITGKFTLFGIDYLVKES